MPEWMLPYAPGSWSAFGVAVSPWAAVVVLMIILCILGLRVQRRWEREAEEAAAHARALARRAALRTIPGGIRRAQKEVDAVTGAIEIVTVRR